MFGHRPDATLVRDLPAVRRFMPFISRRRQESIFYMAQPIDAEPALAFLEELNARRPPERPVTMFHLVLRSLAVMFHERPRVNRFVAGGRLWQRDGVWLSLSAKRSLDEGGAIITVKRRFEPDETLEEMADAILDRVARGRRGEKTTSDREVDLMLRLPVPLIRLLVGLSHAADALGLLPRSMTEADPLYASAFVANLGSVGLDAGYHHLWEHGNCPVFTVIGRVAPDASGRRKLVLKHTYDERIEDGFYAAGCLDRVRERLEHPEKL